MDELKLWIWSDLHLELDSWWFPKRLPRADVAVVAGDIHRAPDSIAWLVRQLDAGVLKVRRVVYVPGNHEYYRREIVAALSQARDAARTFGIDLLDMDEVVIDGVRFLGGTLWTDYALDGDIRAAAKACFEGMNDHKLIEVEEVGRTRLHRTDDDREMHRAYVDWFRRKLETEHPGPTVCVTHHGVSRNSIAPKWMEKPTNPGYASDLTWLIARHQPELWCHGHVHQNRDYRLGRTRVVCNPKGYGGPGFEENLGFKPRLIVRIPKPEADARDR
jgi:predicted phosphodiesterase